MSDSLRLPKVKKAPKISKYTPKSKYSELEALPTGTNIGLTSPDNSFMLKTFGEPRLKKDYDQKGKGLDNPVLEALHKDNVDVGPFKVNGLMLAQDSLRKVLKDVSTEQPEVYKRIGRDAMRNVRFQRDSTSAISNHSWGTAIDMKIDGLIDPWRDGKTQNGLSLIVPIFNRHGWFWGGAYKPRLNKKTGKMKIKEDAMHFEVSKEKLLEWAKLGYFGPNAPKLASVESSKAAGVAPRTVSAKQSKTNSHPIKQKPLPTSNVVRKPPPQDIDFITLLKQRPSETFPDWYGKNGWVTKVRSRLGWFRK